MSSIASKLDWSKFESFGLSKKVLASLNALRQRNGAARSRLEALKEADKPVDFAHYREILSNKKIVDEIEKKVATFKPSKFDVNAQVKIIEAFESKALQNAQETANVVQHELAKLHSTLKNIESARSFDDLTINDVSKAAEEIDQKLVELVNKGQWVVPGYKEKFGDYTVM